MFWKRKELKELKEEIKCLKNDLELMEAEFQELKSRSALCPHVPNNGFFVTHGFGSDNKERKEWISNQWRMINKINGRELWVKD